MTFNLHLSVQNIEDSIISIFLCQSRRFFFPIPIYNYLNSFFNESICDFVSISTSLCPLPLPHLIENCLQRDVPSA